MNSFVKSANKRRRFPTRDGNFVAVGGGKMSEKIYEHSATLRCNAKTFSSLINLCKRFYVN